MIYIQKEKIIFETFEQIVAGLDNYEDLKDEPREKVIQLLLREQRGLCAICERKAIRFAPTIEHFMPKSIFPALQLNYYNLYISCQACNEPKAHFLIPPYLFDPRFAPFGIDALKPVYEWRDGKVYVTAPQLSKYEKSEHKHAHILQSTLDLLQQNRDKTEKSSLLSLRAVVWKTWTEHSKHPNWVEKIRKLKDSSDYPEFVSVVGQLCATILKKKPI
ncbi:MAG: hypothetical protein RLZZ628_1828 [Bacteroidota bacterium]|jgi:hypothetical protein